MLRKVILTSLIITVLLTGCQISRTRKQTIFNPDINNKTKRCQSSGCHKQKKIDYYSKYAFSHNQHFATTDAKNCDACHDEKKHTKGPVEIKLKFESCRSQGCHGRNSEKGPTPHGAWKETKIKHGKQANKDINSCGKCHAPVFCRVCHKVDMPHPKKWINKHGPFTTIKGTDKCLLCHKSNKTNKMDFCFTCHAVPMPHPNDIKKIHGNLAKQIGTKKCFQCHNEKTFCTDCHKTKMPHPKSFINSHYKEIKSIGASACVQCHKNNTPSKSGCFGGDCHTNK